MPGVKAIAVLNYSEHILFHRLLTVCLLYLLLRLVQLFQADHLILRIIRPRSTCSIHYRCERT